MLVPPWVLDRLAGAEPPTAADPARERARSDDAEVACCLRLGCERSYWRSTHYLTLELSMLISLPPEHKKNFRRLQQAATTLEPAEGAGTADARRTHGYSLMRFYAVESGLKYLLHDLEKIPHRHQIDGAKLGDSESVEDFGHDLQRMAKRLRVPAMHAPQLSNSFRLHGGYKPNGAQQNFPISQAHEAWRYGLVIVTADQDILLACLNGLILWITNQLEGG